MVRLQGNEQGYFRVIRIAACVYVRQTRVFIYLVCPVVLQSSVQYAQPDLRPFFSQDTHKRDTLNNDTK